MQEDDLVFQSGNPWSYLEDVYRLSREKRVDFSLSFSDADDSWSFSVQSAAPAENWTGKSMSFRSAAESVIEYLRSL